MSDIQVLESRINAALDRIRRGVDAINIAPQAVGPDPAVLQQQLMEEQSANAQLEERVHTLKAMQEDKLALLEVRVAQQLAQMAALDAEMQGLRQSNADLREMNAQLRSAVADGVSSPELVNRAMMAEIDALAAQRSSEAAEVDAILSELKPLTTEAE